MKIAINKKYKYISLERDNDTDLDFNEWVMQDKFDTHSILEIPNTIGINYLRYNQFDYNEKTDTFSFDLDKHYNFIEKEIENESKPTEQEMQTKQIQAIRFAVQKLIRIDELTEDELNSIMMLYNEYEVDAEYKVDDIFRYEGVLYRVILGHKSQEDWKPNELPALYTKIIPGGVIEEWGDRDLTINPFMIGDKVIYKDVIYESVIDNNVWNPEEYTAGWKEVG